LGIVAKFAEIGKRTATDYMALFTQLDRLKRGTIPQGDLVRELTALGSATAGEIQTLFARYQRNREFDYVAFCKDLPSCSLATAISSVTESPALIGALRHYRAFLLSRRGDSRQIFLRFDQAGTGRVPVETVQIAFVSAGIILSPQEISVLLEVFTDKVIKGRFLYREMDARAAKEVILPDQIAGLLNPLYAIEDARLQLNGTISELREKFAGRRVRPRTLFKNVTKITIEDVARKIYELNIIIQKSQLDILNRAYGADAEKGFQWDQFCDDCERSSIVGPTRDP
jgi:Ca2+-binding EF-hand superfamily protein